MERYLSILERYLVMHITPAARNYRRRSWRTAITYVAVIAANTSINHFFPDQSLLITVMAVISALPIIALIAVLAVYLREETDEYVRNRSVLSILLALGVVLSLSSMLGMLQLGGLVGHVPIFLVFVAWACTWGITKFWLEWRDRRGMAKP